jgi:hypothetical protein
MTGIAIYIEGGGDSRDGKAALRLGFDVLLSPQKTAARTRGLRWRLVLCGGRNDTFNAFQHAARTERSELIGLLVDSEDPVENTTPTGRLAHLVNRDRWTMERAWAEHVHLMTQCMESWIVADAEMLTGFYGQNFNASTLPRRRVLDDEPKHSIYAGLESATRRTQKGSYGKIKHASELLTRIRPDVVAARCASFQRFAEWLTAAIAV